MGSRSYVPGRKEFANALRLKMPADLDRTEGVPAPVGTGKPPCGRNAPCPCGSGKKYKVCVKLGHGARVRTVSSEADLMALWMQSNIADSK